VFSNNQQIALASGMILWAISMPYQYIVTGQDVSLVYSLLEGVIAGCFVLIFEQAFIAFRVGTRRMYASNERFIGMFAVLIVALFGCPLIATPVNVLFMLCSGLLLYNSYRFDSSVGVATGAIVGLVLAFQMENVNLLAVMILLAGMIILLKDMGKVGVLLAYLAGYICLGYMYDNSLLEVQMLTGTIVVSLFFLLVPRKWLKQVSQIRDGSTVLSQDLLIQEATKSKISEFGQAFLTMEKMLQVHEEERGEFEPHGLSNIYLSGDGISLLNVVESQSNRLAELRKNFIRQLGQIGDIITTFPAEIVDRSLQTEFFEGRVTEKFGRMGVGVSKALLIKDKDDKVKVYVSCYMYREQLVTGELLAERLSGIVNVPLVCVDRGQDVVSRTETHFCFVEQGAYMLTTGVVRRNRTGERYCGDNFSITKIDTQKAVLMLSDGMGTGENASVKSQQVVELLEQLLSAGFRKELAIELLNSFVSFLEEGEISSSLDLAVVDFYTGDVDFIKLGASTTFIKRGDKIECIRSTSLPVGVLEQVEFDTCTRKLYHGDVVVMVSDGVLDGIIFEDKEEYLADVIAKQKTTNAQAMAESIMSQVERMQRGTMRDDSTILVAGVWER
jgi:serine/threonine protein phosphatase PrpC